MRKEEKNCRQKVKWVRTCATNSRHWTRHTCNVCTQKKCHKFVVVVVVSAKIRISFSLRLLRDLFTTVHTAYAIWISSTTVCLCRSFDLSTISCNAFKPFSLPVLFAFYYVFLYFRFQDVSNFLLSWCVRVSLCVYCLFRADLIILSSLKRYFLHRMNCACNDRQKKECFVIGGKFQKQTR